MYMYVVINSYQIDQGCSGLDKDLVDLIHVRFGVLVNQNLLIYFVILSFLSAIKYYTPAIIN